MRSPLSFDGRIRRFPYAVASTAAFFSQHAAVAALFVVGHQHLVVNWRFYLVPLRSVLELRGVPEASYALAFAFGLIAAWVLAVLAFRRSIDANKGGWAAAMVIAPIVQIFVIVVMAVMPSRPVHVSTAVDSLEAKRRINRTTAIEGMLAGMGLTVFAVAVGALIFGVYGYGLFVVSPFLIGVTTAFLANRKEDIGDGASIILAFFAAALGGIALVAVALEGIICVVLAAPLAAVVAIPGAMLGRAMAMSGRRRPQHSLMSVAFLPIVFLSEQALPPSATIDTHQSIEVAAPVDAVWRSVIHMDNIDGKPALPFRLGVAYPVSARILGEGVGAKRLGIFSTGVAVERVTQWQPGRRLSFEVLSDPPAMHELSPYREVHAPHVVGYFHTTLTTFELTPMADGRTRVALSTSHELKLDPVLYWLPLARWVVSQDDARVLNHIRAQAERQSAPERPAA